MDPPRKHQKIKLAEINPHLTCRLCKGYLIDVTTISECLHSFCRSCIIKFLQKNCYCPVCEVIINKAKPCLKLDKTLQDIVYKLVPGLFIKEMKRRKQFYAAHPSLAIKVTPEERGEDTERTIFNPEDDISLSIEYISDDSAPGAITVLPSTPQLEPKPDETPDNPMKRYLQCPGGCRIDVLKKFLVNKYNIDTNLFHIDILYKRVPLPNHYTLIDIGYIFSWKRNEPMKFFFRITDINKVTERFDYFDGRATLDLVVKPPRPTKWDRERTSKATLKRSEIVVKKEVQVEKTNPIKMEDCHADRNKDSSSVAVVVKSEKTDKVNGGAKVIDNKRQKRTVVSVKNPLVIKSEIADEIKSKVQSGQSDLKNPVYTNITLNREDNVEIITKIHKVSNKEGQPIGLNIVNHTVKKTNKVHDNKAGVINSKLVPKSGVNGSGVTRNNSTIGAAPSKTTTPKFVHPKSVSKSDQQNRETPDDIAKSNFLKSIELTARVSPPLTSRSLNQLKAGTSQKTPVSSPPSKPKFESPKPSTAAQKRKNSSPIKNDKEKKPKTGDKKPLKIIIQPKTIANPTVRQMVTNVNQNVNNMSRIVEQSTSKATDLQSLIDNCKLNIPASLSITLNESGYGNVRTPPSIAPVKNYIEILKLPDNTTSHKNETEKVERVKVATPISSPSNNGSCKLKLVPTFQKIFEESIKKSPEPGGATSTTTATSGTTTINTTVNTTSSNVSNSDTKSNVDQKGTKPLDLTSTDASKEVNGGANSSPSSNTNTNKNKRNLHEITSKLHNKKTKIEQDRKKEDQASKLTIPHAPIQTLKPSIVPAKYDLSSPIPQNHVHKTTANLHSSNLGMNYTVSVSQNKASKMDVKTAQVKKESPTKSPSPKKSPHTPSSSKAKNLPSKPSSPVLSPNQLLEKYKIQNIAQYTASFNFNTAGFMAAAAAAAQGNTPPNGQMNAALKHAMLLNHNWYGMQQAPLLHYEKYLQSMNASQNAKKIMGGNIKEN